MTEKKQHLEEAKELSMGYFLTGMVILLIATLLGFLKRLSQTGIIEFRATSWYTLMTLHGMAAFVGGGVFLCMGLTWYVLVNVLDKPLHSTKLVKLGYYIFMTGVALIVIATLFGNYAASWVFLHPLSFEAAGAWDNWAVIVWVLGVICAGVAILIVEFEVLLTIKSAGYSIINAVGVEALAPEPEGGYKTPVVLVPFAVNAVGMIIATIPFAGLLIAFLLQGFGLVSNIDALLAKNILWWFGHPVVYALLFPSAGFGYYMVERLTGGKIIGERLTKIAWFVAVAVQNIIGSHHVYQDLVNPLPVHVSQQILTYAITIPSLASLYVIIGTLYLRKFEWDISAKFLFLSILGWILAGLSGVVNATIFWNVYIHNTLWIVAHFHAMAILNIMMMLAAISYFLIRDYTGTELYNEKLARIGMWHIYIGVMGFVHMWFIQGIMGGIRRSMTSTPNLGLYTWLSIPFALAALIGFWLSVFVILKTIQNGKQNE